MLEISSICLAGPGMVAKSYSQAIELQRPACAKLSADSLAGDCCNNKEIESTGNASDADSMSRSNPPGRTRTLNSCLHRRLLGGRGKKGSALLFLSFFALPSTKGYYGMGPFLDKTHPLCRRKYRQLMDRNKVRVKNMLLFSTLS